MSKVEFIARGMAALFSRPGGRLAVRLALLPLLLAPLVFDGPVHAVNEVSVKSISSSIMALDSARHTAVQDLENTSLEQSEVSDYKDFIAYLNTRILNYCRELQQFGALEALNELPCPTGSPGAAQAEGGQGQGQLSSAAVEAGTAQTAEEKTAAKQDEFMSALGEFDDMLLKEDEQIASRIPSQRETGASGRQGTTGSSSSTGQENDGEGDTSGTPEQGSEAGAVDVAKQQQAGAGSTADRPAGSGGLTDSEAARSGAPEGRRPPPEDDDIVARQLREAAEKEPDPELKKKLWEEYWKYKGVAPKNG